MRSGWKGSKSTSFSPTAKRIGLPVTSLTDRAAPPGVAVELGQHDAVDPHRPGERLGDAHRLLAGHGVDHEEHVVGGDDLPHAAQLVHQRLVDLEAPGGVEDDDVLPQPPGFRPGVAGH